MNSPPMSFDSHRVRSIRRSFPVRALRAFWTLVRLPALAVLLAFEPLVSLLLTATGVLGIAAALILRISGDQPRLPFCGMLGFSVGTLLLLTTYHCLIHILAR